MSLPKQRAGRGTTKSMTVHFHLEQVPLPPPPPHLSTPHSLLPGERWVPLDLHPPHLMSRPRPRPVLGCQVLSRGPAGLMSLPPGLALPHDPGCGSRGDQSGGLAGSELSSQVLAKSFIPSGHLHSTRTHLCALSSSWHPTAWGLFPLLPPELSRPKRSQRG